jgi:hypothetical protein
MIQQRARTYCVSPGRLFLRKTAMHWWFLLGTKFFFILVGLYASALGGNAFGQTIASANKPCHRDYAQYRNNPDHKAFVVTVGRYPKQSCGMSWGYQTKQGAIEQAFKECGFAAVRHKMPKKACRLLTAK